jgi:hypothetical protein
VLFDCGRFRWKIAFFIVEKSGPNALFPLAGFHILDHRWRKLDVGGRDAPTVPGSSAAAASIDLAAAVSDTDTDDTEFILPAATVVIFSTCAAPARAGSRLSSIRAASL